LFEFGISVLFALIPGLILFLYGIEQFSKELQASVGKYFRGALGKVTKTPLRGLVTGTIFTSIVQSSTATTVITVSLVNAGLISFYQSLGIIFGVNIGTTVTAQLVAFKLTFFAPVLILVGFGLDLVGRKYKVFGKPIFYFGLVFFGLSLMSDAVAPLRTDPAIVSLLTSFSFIPLGILAGFILTNVFQSSSVVTGILVVLAANGLVGLGQALPIIFGADIGTTTTALIASYKMNVFAKRAAVAHFLFNVLGVLIFLPFVALYISFISGLGGSPAQQVANAQTIFKVIIAFIFIIFISQFRALVERIIPSKEKEILLKSEYLEKLPEGKSELFDAIQNELMNSLSVSLRIFDSTTASLKGKDNSQQVTRLEELANFLHEKITSACLVLSKKNLSDEEVERVVLLSRTSDLVEQVSNMGSNLGAVASQLKEQDYVLSKESLRGLDEVYGLLRKNLVILVEEFPKLSNKSIAGFRKNEGLLRERITVNYEIYLERLSKDSDKTAGTAFGQALAMLQDSEEKVREVRKLFN
jgi:phosphate:Na+ symporter